MALVAASYVFVTACFLRALRTLLGIGASSGIVDSDSDSDMTRQISDASSHEQKV